MGLVQEAVEASDDSYPLSRYPGGGLGRGLCDRAQSFADRKSPLPNPPPGYRERGSDRRAFTLFELLIATAVVGLILASVVPFVLDRREQSRRVQCQNNLRTLRDALKAYSDAHRAYPRVRYDPAVKPEGYAAFTGPDAADPFVADSAVQPNDVTAALWLLVRGGYVKDTTAFVCPSTDDWPDRGYDARGTTRPASQRSNFRSGHHLSYSVFCMYGTSVKDFWNDTLQSNCALMADKNPGTADNRDPAGVPTSQPAQAYAKTNSPNHGHAVQNVLYADGSVQEERNPYVGSGYQRSTQDPRTGMWSAVRGGDNIYTALSPTPLPPGQTPPADGPGVTGKTVSPAWPYDTYLVPAAAD